MCSNDVSLAACIDALAAVDVTGLTVAGLQELVATAATGQNRLAGVVSRAVGELQVRGSGQVPDPAVEGALCPTPAWLRSVTLSTGTAAGRLVRTSVALRELPMVVDAVVGGTITEEHGQILTRLVGKIDADALLRSQPELLDVARRTDPGQLAVYVRHLLATWCEPDLEAEEEAAEDRRFLQLRNTHRGSWRGTFELPDAEMEVVLTVLEPLARRAGDDDARSAGKRRADALTDVFGLAARHAELPDAGGSRPVVTYVVPAWWTPQLAADLRRLVGDPLASLDALALPAQLTGAVGASTAFSVDLDQHPGRECATGAWAGPATRSTVDRLLCDARIQRVVLDDLGQVVSLTSATEQVTAAQRRAIAARDRCCVAKGCTKPPAFCDVHHLRARADGGATTLDNCVLLCRRHHVMWHRQLLDLTDLRAPWKRLPQPRAPDLA